MKQVLALALFAGLFYTISCDNTPTGSATATAADSVVAEEAFLMAQWIHGEISCPPTLRERVKSDLVTIRDRDADIPETTIRYFSPVYSGFIDILFEASVYDSVLSGNYHDWDTVNDSLGIDSIVVEQLSYAGNVYARLYFDKRMYSSRVVEIYAAAGLSGVWYIDNRWAFLDGDYLVALQKENTILYFFRHGYGDCYSGCYASRVAAFSATRFGVTCLGTYATTSSEPIPGWWDDFITAVTNWYDQGVVTNP